MSSEPLRNLVLNSYIPSSASNILLSGSFFLHARRAHQFRTSYLDLSSEFSVDHPNAGIGMLPFSDAHFDFICVEHPKVADMTSFLELTRILGEGGTLCIMAPCNPQPYRMADDTMLAYPDTGLALESGARSRGIAIAMIESFVSGGTDVACETLVAVYGKGGNVGNLLEVRLHTQLEAQHIWTFDTRSFVQPSRRGSVNKGKTVRLTDFAGEVPGKNRLTPEDIEELQGRLSTVESVLRQREEEIDQAWREVASLRADLGAANAANEILSVKLAESDAWVFSLAHERQKAVKNATRMQNHIEKLITKVKQQTATIDRLGLEVLELREVRRTLSISFAAVSDECQATRQQFRKSEEEREAACAELRHRVNELGLLGRVTAESERELSKTKLALDSARAEAEALLRENSELDGLFKKAEAGRRSALEQREWLALVYESLSKRPWWWQLMPRQWRQKREQDLLRRKALFDAEGYVGLYKDVASDGMDPLRHYIIHGMSEGRALTR